MSDSAIHPELPRTPTFLSWLFNPFRGITGWWAMGTGLAAIVVAGLVASLTGSRFTGAFDFTTGSPIPLWLPVLEGLVNWLCSGLLLFLAGKLVAKTDFRILDVFGSQALARGATLLAGLVAFIPGYRAYALTLVEIDREPNPADALGFMLASVVILVVMIWMAVLQYRAYTESCKISGDRAVLSFMPAFVLAHVLSGTVLHSLLSPWEPWNPYSSLY